MHLFEAVVFESWGLQALRLLPVEGTLGARPGVQSTGWMGDVWAHEKLMSTHSAGLCLRGRGRIGGAGAVG